MGYRFSPHSVRHRLADRGPPKARRGVRAIRAMQDVLLRRRDARRRGRSRSALWLPVDAGLCSRSETVVAGLHRCSGRGMYEWPRPPIAGSVSSLAPFPSCLAHHSRYGTSVESLGMSSERKRRWEPLRRALGEVIQTERETRGTGIRELAELANGMPVSSLARIEGAGVTASLDMMCDVADGLGWTASELLLRAERACGIGTDDDSSLSRTLGTAERELVQLFSRLEPQQQALMVGVATELARVSHAFTNEHSANRTTPEDHQDSPRHYMLAWRRDTAHAEVDDERLLDHIGSNQLDRPFRKIRPGDIVWAVFVEGGRLNLVGRLVVASRGETDASLPNPDGAIFSQREAERVARRRNAPQGIWRAAHHVFARGKPEPVRIVELEPPLVLEFDTASADSSELRIGREPVSTQSIRSIRNLSPASTENLETAWRAAKQTRE